MKVTSSGLSVLVPLALAAGAKAQPPGMQGMPPMGGMPGMPPLPSASRGTMIHSDLAYVPSGHEKQKLDLYLPPSKAGSKAKRPVIVYIHGGAFMFGDKKSSFLPLRLLSKGYAIASLDYRLSGDAQAPAQIQDCKAAVRWLRAHASQYRLDPRRFVSWGESAGGNMAALLGTAAQAKYLDVGANLKYSSAVQGVVDLYGPTDFLQMDAHRLPGGDAHDPADSPESKLIGGAIQKNKAKVARVNPITYVSRQTAPFFIAHGEQDHTVPFNQSEILVAALRKSGVKVTFLPVSGADHGFRDATPAQLQQIDAGTDKFLAGIFGVRR